MFRQSLLPLLRSGPGLRLRRGTVSTGLTRTQHYSSIKVSNESSGEITTDTSPGTTGKPSEHNEDQRLVQVWESMSVSKLANGLRLNPMHVRKLLKRDGVMVDSHDTVLTTQQAEAIVYKLGHTPTQSDGKMGRKEVSAGVSVDHQPGQSIDTAGTGEHTSKHYDIQLTEEERQAMKKGAKMIRVFKDMTVFQLAYKLDLHPKTVWSTLRERGVDVENVFAILTEQQADGFIAKEGHIPKHSPETVDRLPLRFRSSQRLIPVTDSMNVRQLANRLNLDRMYVRTLLENEGLKNVGNLTVLTTQLVEDFITGLGHVPKLQRVFGSTPPQKDMPQEAVTESTTLPQQPEAIIDTTDSIATALAKAQLKEMPPVSTSHHHKHTTDTKIKAQISRKEQSKTPKGTKSITKNSPDDKIKRKEPQRLRREAHLVSRPPIVTIMGHVDHGKTTLLDSLRKTSVAASEAGGITQHIGAFTVKVSSGQQITFLDTPGHAAFTAMRSRGAHSTDIVVLVVAADDGIMEQTVESIRLVKEAQVPMVVAINKCDKHGVNTTRIKTDLLKYGVQLEEFGGDIQAIQVSALKGTGLDSLEEAIAALAEISDLRADPGASVEGVVIETKMDKGLGPVSTVIVQEGTLKPGDVLVAGETWGKMRLLLDQSRKPLKQAPPSTPVLTVGWKELPAAGDEITQAKNEQVARELCDSRAASSRNQLERSKVGGLVAGEDGRAVIPLVVRGDVTGSVEVLVELLRSKQPEELELNVVATGVGGVTEGDVEMAASTGGYLLAFNVSVSKTVHTLARNKGVTIISHNVIYKLMDMLKETLQAQLPPVWVEEVVGEAVILKVFKLTGARRASVGGCRVKQGKLVRNALYRIIRDGETIHEGPVSGLKLGKEDIETARKETECGVSFSTDPGYMEGDRVVCFNKDKRPTTLNWNLGF